jgi:hypothetical protein
MIATMSLFQVLDQPSDLRVSLLEIVGAFVAEISKVVAEKHKGILEVKTYILLSLIRVRVVSSGDFACGSVILYSVNAIGSACKPTLSIVGVSLQLASDSRDVDQAFIVSLSTETEDE